MREIKFRTYNAMHDKMDYSPRLKCYDNEFDNDRGCGLIDLNERINEGYRDIIFMQFTGLKDSNGKEIYEGDIVLCSADYCGEIKAIIAYDETIGSFVLKDKKGSSFILYKDERKTYHYSIENVWEDIEVIGNIYENPELL